MAKVLGVGTAALDTIFEVDRYPGADTKTRARSRRTSLGGNATNTLTVLAELGHRCALLAQVGDDREGESILAKLRDLGIDPTACRPLPGVPSLVTQVLLGLDDASRTIVHHRELPELALADFDRVDLAGVDWAHFEGRDATETLAMVRTARQARPQLRVSLELERRRPGVEALVGAAHLHLFSRSFVREGGFDRPEPFLEQCARQAPQSQLVCAWGEQGAFGWEAGRLFHVPALKVEPVDTLGAGDTFNAGLLDALLRGEGLESAVRFANRLAGLKCAQRGLAGLAVRIGRRG